MIGLRDFDALDLISNTAQKLSAGEIMQIEKSITRSMTEDFYFDMIKQKTASLIATSCELGAITTTKDQEDRNATYAFGENLGVAFQIKDDLLDLLGSEIETGKNSGGDVKQNMITLPLIHTKINTSRSDYRKLKKLLKTKTKNKKIISSICEIIEKTGGIDYSKDKLEEFSDRALSAISSYPDSITKRSMKDLVDFNKNRTK